MDKEILLTADAEGSPWSVVAWNVHTGTRVASFRGPPICPSTLTVLSDQALLATENNRPVLHVWRLSRGDCVLRKQNLLAPATALCVDFSACWCAVAMAERVNIYHMTSGILASSLVRHYQAVTCLRFSDDGAILVSAGQDSLTIVWHVTQCVDVSDARRDTNPLHVWSDHALPVTGVHVGGGGIRARVFTCSLDRSCRIYQLYSGQLLLSVSFNCALTSIVADRAEMWLFVGGQSGQIMRLSLHQPPRALHTTYESLAAADCGEKSVLFSGHTASVNCLCVSHRSATLVSGSADGGARVWSLQSGQCLQVLTHRGAVNAVRFIDTPSGMTDSTSVKQSAKPLLLAEKFQRQPALSSDILSLPVQLPQQPALINCLAGVEYDELSADEDKDALRKQLAHYQHINSTMYNFMVDKISQGVLSSK